MRQNVIYFRILFTGPGIVKRKEIKMAKVCKSVNRAKKKKNGGKKTCQPSAAEYVSNLIELHKLQGTLLAKLKRQVLNLTSGR